MAMRCQIGRDAVLTALEYCDSATVYLGKGFVSSS